MILIFSVRKSQNSNEEEKTSVTAKAYLKLGYCIMLWILGYCHFQ